jgi:hypothetical protein
MVLTLVKSIGGANNFIRQTFFKKHRPGIRQREIHSIFKKTYTVFVGKLQAISSLIDIITHGALAVSCVDGSKVLNAPAKAGLAGNRFDTRRGDV